MNLILLEQHQFITPHTAKLTERQITHIRDILKAGMGAQLYIGLLDGEVGQAMLNTDTWQLTNIVLDSQPPETMKTTLVLALPRPQMLKRILQTCATYGVDDIQLIQTQRVEKNYWQSPKAHDDAIRHELLLGLEQAKATQLPTIKKYTCFRDYIAEQSPYWERMPNKYFLHPGNFPTFGQPLEEGEKIVAIGPEGGFTMEEYTCFTEQGFQAQQLGKRILRVETAVNAVLARISLG